MYNLETTGAGQMNVSPGSSYCLSNFGSNSANAVFEHIERLHFLGFLAVCYCRQSNIVMVIFTLWSQRRVGSGVVSAVCPGSVAVRSLLTAMLLAANLTNCLPEVIGLKPKLAYSVAVVFGFAAK